MCTLTVEDDASSAGRRGRRARSRRPASRRSRRRRSQPAGPGSNAPVSDRALPVLFPPAECARRRSGPPSSPRRARRLSPSLSGLQPSRYSFVRPARPVMPTCSITSRSSRPLNTSERVALELHAHHILLGEGGVSAAVVTHPQLPPVELVRGRLARRQTGLPTVASQAALAIRSPAAPEVSARPSWRRSSPRPRSS
jgi:hypothetical protein